MGNRTPKGPEDEPVVGLTEWVDLMVEKREKNMKNKNECSCNVNCTTENCQYTKDNCSCTCK